MAIVGVALLVALLVAAAIRSPVDWRGDRPVLSAYNIVIVGFALYVVLAALLTWGIGDYTAAPTYYSDKDFANIVWICVLAFGVFWFSNFLFRYRWGADRDSLAARAVAPVEPSSKAQKDPSQKSRVDLLCFALLAVGLLLKVFILVRAGGVDSLIRISGSGQKISGLTFDDAEIRLFTASGLADGAATWGLIRALKDRYREKTWFALFVVTLMMSYSIMGKRLVVLLPVFCVVIAFHVYRKPLTNRLLPMVLVAGLALGFVSILFRVFVPAALGGYSINLDAVSYAQGSLWRFYFYSLEFSSLEMMTVISTSRAELVSMFGGLSEVMVKTNLEPLLYTIPRAVWPGKPERVYDVSYAISALLGNGDFEKPTVGYASTLVGTSLLAGLLGVVVAMFILGVITAAIDSRLRRGAWSELSVALYAIGLVFVFHIFRQGSLGWAFIVAIVQNYGIIAALVLLGLQSRPGRLVAVEQVVRGAKRADSARTKAATAPPSFL